MPYSVAIFGVLAVVVASLLHATPVGRAIFAIGANQEAAFFSGIRVKRIKLGLFVLSGLFCAIAGILWTLRFASARYDAGTGLELNVVTIVLLGGISIFGGRGHDPRRRARGRRDRDAAERAHARPHVAAGPAHRDRRAADGERDRAERRRSLPARTRRGCGARPARRRRAGARGGRRSRSERAAAHRRLRHRPGGLLAAVRGPARAAGGLPARRRGASSRELGADVVSAGLVDTPEGAREAGETARGGPRRDRHASTRRPTRRRRRCCRRCRPRRRRS